MSEIPHGQNSALSTTIPGLQFAWDSVSLGALKTCPRYYYYAIIQGYTPLVRSVDLDFGIYYHGALERYDHARARGETHEEALLVAVRWTLGITWDTLRQRPWASEDPNKNRRTLVRTIVWYLDQFNLNTEDPLATIILANGKPAVELSFRFELGGETPGRERYLYCGHLDKMVFFQGHPWIVDRKTTKHTLDDKYFSQFTPDNQFSGYSVASQVIFDLPARGVIVDAAQVAVTFSRYHREFVQRDEAQLEEWLSDARTYVAQAEQFALAKHWPMNDKACFRCAFRPVCSTSPKTRQQWLDKLYTRRTWDPLVARGDI